MYVGPFPIDILPHSIHWSKSVQVELHRYIENREQTLTYHQYGDPVETGINWLFYVRDDLIGLEASSTRRNVVRGVRSRTSFTLAIG